MKGKVYFLAVFDVRIQQKYLHLIEHGWACHHTQMSRMYKRQQIAIGGSSSNDFFIIWYRPFSSQKGDMICDVQGWLQVHVQS